jgi:hypothetical protein
MAGSAMIFALLAADRARRQIGADHDAALLIVALDLRRARAEADVGHHLERHAAAARGRHRQILDSREAAAAILVEHHADRDLAIREREFGDILIDVAERRDADRLAQRLRGDAEIGGEIEARLDRDFGARQIAFDPRRADRPAASSSARPA